MAEERLEEIINQTMETNGVVGAMIIDSDGFCMAELCSRIGIFKRVSGDRTVEWGPYGHLLLNQAKSMWLNRNLNKYPNTHLVESLGTSKIPYAFISNLSTSLLDAASSEQPLGVVNVCVNVESSQTASKKPRLLDGLKSATRLNMHRIEWHDVKKARLMDTMTYWQNERLNWWMKFLNRPENVSIEKFESDDALEPDSVHSNIVYRRDADDMSLVCETISYSPSPKMLKSPISSSNEGKQTTLITCSTSPELIIECVLHDSVELPSDEENKELAKYDLKQRTATKFSLDLALSPYKLAIIYKRDDDNAKNIANDLREMLYLGNISSLLMFSVENDTESLNKRYDSLDILGVPYSLYLPSCVTKDGFCYIRNRETTLREKTHISHVIKHFRAVLDSLNF